MTTWGWAAWVVVLLAYALVLWGVRADRRDYTEIRADLDELAGEHHSPADRMAALEQFADDTADIVTTLEQQRLATGRHAHTGQDRAAT